MHPQSQGGNIPWALIISALFAILLVDYLLKSRRHPRRNLPSPFFGGLPGALGGHALLIDTRDLINEVERFCERFKRKPFYLNMLGGDITVISDVKECRRMLALRPTVFSRPEVFADTLELLINGPFLFAENGQHWARTRRLTAPAFSQKNVDRMLSAMVRVSDRLVAKWGASADANAEVNALEDASRAAHNIFALTGIGIDPHSLGPYGDSAKLLSSNKAQALDTYEAIDALLPAFQRVLFVPMGRFAYKYMGFLPFVSYYNGMRRKVDAIINTFIAAERRSGSSKQISAAPEDEKSLEKEENLDIGSDKKLHDDSNDDEMEEKGGADGQLMKAIAAACDGPSYRFTDHEVLCQTKGFFVAGSDTTSITITAMLHFLATHPDKMEAARREVDTVLRNTGGRFKSVAQAQSLRYIEACMKEALRLRSPAAFIIVSTAKDDTVVAGQTYPKGWDFWLMTRLLARSAENFSEPLKFVPERWLGDEERENALGNGAAHNTEAAMFFGEGPRKCPGKSMAMLEGVVVVASVLAALDVESATGDAPIGEVTDFTTRPVGVSLKFRRRTPATTSNAN